MKKINWKEKLLAAGPISWILFALTAFCVLLFLVNPDKSYFLLQGGALAAAGLLFTGWKGGYFRKTSPISWILTGLLLAALGYIWRYPSTTTAFQIITILLGVSWLAFISYRVWQRGLFRKTGPIGWVPFALSVLFGAIWLCQPGGRVYMILCGLFGVSWLCYISLGAWKRGLMKTVNPFTLLIALCVVLMAVFTVWSNGIEGSYFEEDEPLNQATLQAQRALNSGLGDSADEWDAYLWHIRAAMGSANHTIIRTNASHRVFDVEGDWLDARVNDTLRVLVAPYAFSDGEGLAILVNGQGEVISAFQAEMDYVYGAGTSSLTRNEYGLTRETYPQVTMAPEPTYFAKVRETSRPEATSPNPTVSLMPTATHAVGTDTASQPTDFDSAGEWAAASSDDPLYQRYFPSFGSQIDRYMLRMAEGSGLTVVSGDEYDYIHFDQWTGQTVVSVHAVGSETSERLIQALNALNEDQRNRLVEQIIWLERATDMARRDNRKARVLKGDGGNSNLYILYEYDYRKHNPLQIQHNQNITRAYDLNILTALMIPAIIVFLAFWVFVDAKKRGQKNPALWAVLTLIGNVIAFIIYMLVRTQTRMSVTGQAAPRGMCPLCGTQLKSDFIACPGCGILLRNRCKNCGRALENDWSFCPYCTSAVTQDGADPNESDAPAIEE